MSKKKQIIKPFKGDNVPNDFDFPSNEIEDIDRAIFDLFDKQISFEIEQKGNARKVPVVFSAGERFALTRRKDPIRDKNNALILPIISIMRKDIDTSPSQHGKGTPIAWSDQPTYYIKKRLDSKDREYQNIINKSSIKNQDNVANRKNFGLNEIFPGNKNVLGTLASRRNSNNLSYKSKNITLENNLGNNIFEIIEIPYPTFMAVKYEVTLWAQYLTQINEMMQFILNNFTGQGHEMRTKTTKGYELTVFFNAMLLVDNNIDSMSDEERMVKYSLELIVPAYMINSKSSRGDPNKTRSYTSAPFINFSYYENNSETRIVNRTNKKENKNSSKFILSDINTDSKRDTRSESTEEIEYYTENPFSNQKELKFSKIISRNQRSGETVISPLVINKIDTQSE